MKVSQLLALCELYHVSPARIMGSVLVDPDILAAQERLFSEMRELVRVPSHLWE